MGFAVPLAIRPPIRPLKMFSRIIGLFGIGIFLNLVSHTFHFEKLRIMGVLQRLSLCYLILVLLHIATKYG
jgi:predicted acyltransferase